MSITNFPDGVSSYGCPQLGNGAEIPVGDEYFFVDSNNGSDGYEGSWDYPLATLDAAVGKCTANINSVIVLKPNHAETIVADSGVDIDVAGIKVTGLGTGADRPTFTFTTAVAADFKLAANNVSIRNILFVAGIDALTGPIEVSADDCAIINCEYRDDDTNNYETTDVIVTASTPLRLLIDGFKFVHDGGSGGTQNQSVIQLNGADGAIIRNCWIVADSGTGVIEDATTSDQILIKDCVLESSNATPKPAIAATATTTGSVVGCSLRIASGTTYVTATTDLQFFETFGTGTDNTAGEKVGTQLSGDIEAKIDVIDAYHDVATADAVTNAVMSDVIGNKEDAAAAGAVSTTESLMAYAKQLVGGQITIDAYHDVATADAVTNVVMSDVIGNKEDAAAAGAVSTAESLMAYAKQLVTGQIIIDDYHDVATADAATNAVMSDVIGNKTDAAVQTAGTTKTIAAYAKGAVDALCGTAGVATWPTAAPYDNAVSIAEAVAYIQDAVRNGTGTGLPANTSLFDMAERGVTTGTAVIANGTATIFTVAGGPIEIENILAVCVTDNDATATTLKFTADPTDGAATDLCTASGSLANAAAGTIVNITGTVANAGVITTNGTAISQAGRLVVPAGAIQTITAVGATTGTWYVAMRYKPLRPGVTVTAAY